MSDPIEPELLDAYLDDELDAVDRTRVDTALAASSALRSELEQQRIVRDQIRSLPPVDPPFGFYERMLSDAKRRRRTLPGVAASVASVAAAWFLVLGLGSGLGVLDTVPSVGDFADRHAEAVEAMPASAVSSGFESMPMDDADDLGPAMVDQSMTMMAAYENDGVVHLLYSDGPSTVSVFREDAGADLDVLGAGERVEMAGGPVWHGTVDEMDVFVAVRGASTFTVVGDPSAMPTMTDIVDHLPDSDRSFLDRARGAARELVETFGLR